METKVDISSLNHIRKGRLDMLNNLSTPVKNKLFDVADYSVKHKLGNVKLSKTILELLKPEDIYMNIKQRSNLNRKLTKSLKAIKDIQEGKQCKNVLSKHINFKKILGSGSFGEVYVGSVTSGNIDFAVKMSKEMKNYVTNEYHIANLLNKLVVSRRAQNFPLMADSYSCDSCDFNTKTITAKKSSCIFSINELATGGDMTSWLSTNPPENHLNSALFQIMAGLHAMQYHYQIVNNDIKAPNILVYNVDQGGYWKYTIHGRDFYVPNFGKLFIVNDFGTSDIFSPKYLNPKDAGKNGLVKLGERVYMVNNDRFEPLNTPAIQKNKFQNYETIVMKWDNGSKTNVNKIGLNIKSKKIIQNPVLTKSQKDRIGYDSTDVRFYDSSLVPPLEFIIDSQDAIRIFTGGKRMNQSQFHVKYNLSKKFVSNVEKYEIPAGKNSSYCTMISAQHFLHSTDLSKLTAGHFILDYFTRQVNYTVPVGRDLIISSIRTS